MTFNLDTSGAVIPAPGQSIGGTGAARFWSDLTPFAQGYIAAMFEAWRDPWTGEAATRWAPQSKDGGETWTWIPVGPDKSETAWWDDSDTDPERRPAFEPINAIGFDRLAPEALASIIADCANFENFTSGLGFKTGEIEGRRFWNGRAAGQLTGAWAAAFPPVTVYLGDDGKVRHEPKS